MATGKHRFGPFEFDPATGELRNCDRSGPDAVQRLARSRRDSSPCSPVGRDQLVTRDEIRRSIWPDVAVDFDASLHFCIRQIRAALGDTAEQPRYVENLPRRGYRILGIVADREEPEAGQADGVDGVEEGRGRRWVVGASVVSAVVALVLIASLVWFAGSRAGTNLASASEAAGEAAGEASAAARPGAPGVARIGILPFDPPDRSGDWGNPGPIAESLLEQLTNQAGARAEVVGPTTTTAFAGTTRSHRELAAEYRLDYLINGRFIHDERGHRMLAELIRVRDGAHVWVRSYDDLGRHAEIGGEVTEATLRELESPR